MIISKTPLRVSFAGGGTDLPGYYRQNADFGAVVSSSINWYIYLTINQKFDGQIRVSYSKTEIVEHADDLEHNIIREALKIVGIYKDIEVVVMSDIPMTGTGLGSSSSLAVEVLNGLYAYKGQHVSAERLATEACHIEMSILNHPVGKQDQYAAAYGGLNYIQFNSDESVLVNPIVCNPEIKKALSSKLKLFFTGITRHSSNILIEQASSISSHLDYHHNLVDLAAKMRNQLSQNDVSKIGELLNDGWISKTKLSSKISTPQIDDWYSKGLEAGAKGGKIVGAGGGGFLMFYCDEDKQNNLYQALPELKGHSIEFEPRGSTIIYNSD